MPHEIIIRRATREDTAAVEAITRAAYAIWVPVIGREPRPMSADQDAAIRDHHVDLLCMGGDVVGLIEMIREDNSLLIESVAVDPKFQQQGCGRRLLDHAEKVALAAGLGTVRLYTNAKFARNIDIYLRRGYLLSGETTLSEGAVRVDMKKEL